MRPKFQYWRSRKHLMAVASLPCMNCGAHGHTQAAHSNLSQHGKGRGIKASDQFVAALCYSCHYELDAGNRLSKNEKQELFLTAMRRTWLELEARELIVDAPNPLVDN